MLVLAPVSVSLAAENEVDNGDTRGARNVVFILADDLGWADTTLYGHTRFYQTPNIERLAKRGMTFTHAYAASPLCSPTRASVLTGLSPARIGITTPACHLPQVVLEATPGNRAPAGSKAIGPNTATRLKTEHYTLAEALQDAGYATGHFGKWHLGHEPYSPLEHGFDVDVPHWPGPGPAGSYVAPWKFPDFDPDTPHEHIEDRMAKEAVEFMQQHKDEPFFLNYWMFSVHAPFDAKKSLIEKHRARVDPDDAQRSPTYAAMIESMDDAVGTLLDTLDRLEIADRTIVIFFSDNGGNMYNEVEGTTPTSNRPLRGGKATMFEGGIRVPCVVIWPGVLTGGTRSGAVVQSSDFYPTLLDMLGLKPRGGQRFDGISIVPALRRVSDSLVPNGRPSRDRRESSPRDRAIFTYFPHAPRVPDWLPPSVAVHQGDWKLIRIFHGGDGGAHRWKLFNLHEDIGETNDLAASQPQRVKELDALIDRFLSDTRAVVPVRNPDFDPAVYRPEDEGQPGPRGPKKTGPRGPRKGPPSKPVAGWRPSRDCKLAIAAAGSATERPSAALIVTSSGKDPYLSYVLPKALPAGRFAARITMASTAAGRGQLFWQEQAVQPAFFRDRSAGFAMTHDGKPHEYRVAFTAENPVTAVRLDPGESAGEIRLSAMKLLNTDGGIVYAWKFAAPRDKPNE
jgi:arylsulfatase A-like enzyme